VRGLFALAVLLFAANAKAHLAKLEKAPPPKKEKPK
jgi:hypothetical protein